MDLRNRGPYFYRIVLMLPPLMLGYLVVSGRWAAATSVARSGSEAVGLEGPFLTGVLWLGSLAPFVLTAWSIGHEHVGARRHGYELLVGAREIVRRALRRPTPESVATAFARPPRDRPAMALGVGALFAVLVPAFFSSFSPDLRTPRGLTWLCIAGVIMGSLAYARHRAMAYLHDEPGNWDLFQAYRMLNPARYEEAGRPFVRWQIVGTVLLGVWWLGGGAILVLHR